MHLNKTRGSAPSRHNGGKALTRLFYKALSGGLFACAAVLVLIIAIVIWRKVIVPEKAFFDLGTEANVVLFMGVLMVICLVGGWIIRRAISSEK